MKTILENSIKFLPGVGPAKSELLKKELNYHTWRDLLFHFPFRYVDRTKFYALSEINEELPAVQVKGTIVHVKEINTGRQRRFTAKLKDHSGTVELVWFKGLKWIKAQVIPGKTYVVFGKPAAFKGSFSFAHPEITPIEVFSAEKQGRLLPIYPTTELMKTKGLDSKGLRVIIRGMLKEVKGKIIENLPDPMMSKYSLMPRDTAFQEIHFPSNTDFLKKAKGRLKLEELFFVQLKILQPRYGEKESWRGNKFDKIGDYFNRFYKESLPFELTGAQKRVLKEIRKDVASGYQMNRLVQGDVGSGKTIVALMSILMGIDNGFQGALMAPTEILAQQHFQGIQELVKELGINVQLLTGSVKQKDRKEIHESLEDGSCHILIGTHALLEDTVQFKNLGIAVIDEQHRFGVAQRSKLWLKNSIPPHVLVMTATPIPRTLAMTVYGDLDSSIIDELPPGRKPIITKHFTDRERLVVFGFIKDQIAKGHQVYIVYPLIEESATMDYKDLMDGYESITRYFPIPEYQVSVVHGRMKPEDKDFEMDRFAKGKTQIMVATTVIEVGVNVPNATVMIIESAERFGLSQLHQLRGRVGRGGDQSYCLLMTGTKLGSEAKVRMKTMTGTNDGFKISEVDLKLRGPGDLTGTQQSGLVDLKLASVVEDAKILSFARERVKEILEEDPKLEKPYHYPPKRYLLANSKEQNISWKRIS
jgi:ATP-dependent DNA helicase RecG